MQGLPLHPAVALVVWSAAVLVLQCLPARALAAAAALALGLALVAARRRTLKLLHRSRWVFVALVVVFFLGTPGLLVLPALGPLGPSYDGLRLAAEHALRLAAIVALVGLLLERMSPAMLVAGLHSLAGPLRWLGVDSRRAALRLMLVLEYADQPPRARWRDWFAPDPPGAALPSSFRLPQQRLGWRDAAALATVAAVAAGVLAMPP